MDKVSCILSYSAFVKSKTTNDNQSCVTCLVCGMWVTLNQITKTWKFHTARLGEILPQQNPLTCMQYTGKSLNGRLAWWHHVRGKSLAAGHRERMGNSKRVLRRSVSLLLGKTDHLHALIFATQIVSVFISESDGCIAIWWVELLTGKPPMVQLMMSPITISGKRLRPVSWNCL